MLPLVHQQIQRLDHLFTLANSFSEEEHIANWSRYLCILASGLIENSVKAFVWRYASKKSAVTIQSYVNKKVQSITNLNCEKLSQFLRSFSEEWCEEFDKTISEKQKAAIDSIIANRNNIAHGSDVGISFVTMKQYYTDAKAVLALLEKIINPDRV